MYINVPMEDITLVNGVLLHFYLEIVGMIMIDMTLCLIKLHLGDPDHDPSIGNSSSRALPE